MEMEKDANEVFEEIIKHVKDLFNFFFEKTTP